MYKVTSFLPTLPVLAEKCCHLLDEYILQISCEHPAALVLSSYLLYLLIIGLEEHVEPLERNIDIRVSALLPMLLLRRLSAGESVTVHLVPHHLVIVAEVNCSFRL